MVSALSWSGSRCCTITKARPMPGLIAGSRPSSADRPPAEAPIPTTGTTMGTTGGPGVSSGRVPPLPLVLAIADYIPFLVVRGAGRCAEAVAHQFQDKLGVFLVFAGAPVEFLRDVVPGLGAFEGRQLAG